MVKDGAPAAGVGKAEKAQSGMGLWHRSGDPGMGCRTRFHTGAPQAARSFISSHFLLSHRAGTAWQIDMGINASIKNLPCPVK
jgi:hypothetical protein